MEKNGQETQTTSPHPKDNQVTKDKLNSILPHQ